MKSFWNGWTNFSWNMCKKGAMDMNLFSVFCEIDPAIYGHGEGATYREEMGEYQFFYRGVDSTTDQVYKSLGDLGTHVTYVERLR